MKTAARVRLIIITVPPPPVAEAIQALREPLCRRWNATWALEYPPHVTLRTGVRVPCDEVDGFVAEFGALLDAVPPFAIRTDPPALGTMTYEGTSGLFLYLPVQRDDPLLELNRTLLTYTRYRKSLRTRFEPHVTLLWGAVPAAGEAWLRREVAAGAPPFDQTYRWLCSAVGLYVRAETAWVPYRVLPLGAALRRSGAAALTET